MQVEIDWNKPWVVSVGSVQRDIYYSYVGGLRNSGGGIRDAQKQCQVVPEI